MNGRYDDLTRIDPHSGHRLARLVLMPVDDSNLGKGNKKERRSQPLNLFGTAQLRREEDPENAPKCLIGPS